MEVNGFSVPYQRSGTGEPVLALHAEDAAGQWRPFHEALAAHADVLAPEHPGFGDAERPEWLDTVLDLAYCHLEVLDKLGLERVHVVGESLGGWVAAELAALAPERVRSLTLIAPMGLLVEGLPDVFIMNRAKWRAVTRFADPEPEASPPTIDQLIKESRVQASLARVGWNPYLHDPRLPHWLHRASMPALVVWGNEDKLMPAATAEQWRELLPNARVQLVERAGHFPALEQPAATASVVLDFFRSQA
ncbi:MAG: alpha/beta fold hydrolase [Chloroflexota bacterium]